MKNLTFGEALEQLKQGKKVARSVWGGYWFLDEKAVVSESDDLEEPMHDMILIVAKLKDGGFAPAQPYQADILAEDWMVVE